MVNFWHRTPLPAAREELPKWVKHSASTLIYTALSASSLVILGAFYYVDGCQFRPLLSYGPFGLTMNCKGLEKSLTINFGLPLFAVGAALKATQSFKKLFQ